MIRLVKIEDCYSERGKLVCSGYINPAEIVHVSVLDLSSTGGSPHVRIGMRDGDLLTRCFATAEQAKTWLEDWLAGAGVTLQ